MRKLKLLTALCASLFSYVHSNAQGCVAIRGNGNTCTLTGLDEASTAKATSWTFAVNNRYFKSFRHFVGTEEQKHRMEEETEVINYVFSTELALTRHLNRRWSVALFALLINNARSSLYEHYGNNSTDPDARRYTRSFGIGDVRFAACYWLSDPAKMGKANAQVGLGIKLPTGDYRYQDYFYRNDSVRVLGPVDQSIQLGDGGTGITLEANAYYTFSKNASIFFNGFYLSNPREHNGVSTARGSAPSATAITYRSDIMSVPDQYMLRLGASYALSHFSFSGGMRLECIPSKDLIGGSNGFRRPGYVLSAEPVVAYKLRQTQFYLSVPVAVQRNRTQSVPDKIRTQKTGVYAKGDAAFADYTINFGIGFSF